MALQATVLPFGSTAPPAPLWSSGPSLGQFYSFPGNGVSNVGPQLPMTHTRQPMVTGTSVVGIKFDGGVVVASDTLGSYGSLARFRSISRLMEVNSTTVIGASGDYADFQQVRDDIEMMVIEDKANDDGHEMSPKSVFSYLTRLMYYQRSRLEPYWNTWVVGGFKDGESFLGYVNMIGMSYESPTVATGIGNYYAQPLLRDAYQKVKSEGRELTEAEAKDALQRALKVLFYRDCRTINKYEFATVTAEGVKIEGPIALDTSWEVAHYVRGYD